MIKLQSKPVAQQVVASLLLFLAFSQQQQVASGWSFYENEAEQDGIPVLSARSIPLDQQQQRHSLARTNPDQLAPVAGRAKAAYEDDEETGQEGLLKRGASQANRLQRRQDPDLEEALEEEEDDDTYKSGSSNRESVENPSYGESRRAQRDGDEIESFFDKHLGAPANAADEQDQEAGPADESRRVHSAQVLATDPDDSADDYAAAASGPIASFLHNLVFHHGQQASETTSTPASSTSGPSESSTAEATPSASIVDKLKRPIVIQALGAGQAAAAAAASETKETSASAQASSPSGGRASQHWLPVAATSQLAAALLAPIMAAPSSVVAYEPQATATGTGGESEGGQQAPEQGVHEIYIGRRPSIMNFLKQAQEQQQQQFAASNENLQHHIHLGGRQPAAAYYQQAAGSAHVWRAPHTMAAYQQATLPVAASHAYQQQQQGYPTLSDEQDSDEQTVTYGLSLGSAHSHGGQEDADGGGQDSAAQLDEEPASRDQAPVYDQDQPQMTPQMMRAQQQHYQQQVAASAAGYVPYSARYRVAQLPQQQQQRQEYLTAQHYRKLQQQQRRLAQHGRAPLDTNGDAHSEALARAAAHMHAAQTYANNQDDQAASYR